MKEIEDLEMDIEILKKVLKEDKEKGGENQANIKREIKIFKTKLTKYKNENNKKVWKENVN